MVENKNINLTKKIWYFKMNNNSFKCEKLKSRYLIKIIIMINIDHKIKSKTF